MQGLRGDVDRAGGAAVERERPLQGGLSGEDVLHQGERVLGSGRLRGGVWRLGLHREGQVRAEGAPAIRRGGLAASSGARREACGCFPSLVLGGPSAAWGVQGRPDGRVRGCAGEDALGGLFPHPPRPLRLRVRHLDRHGGPGQRLVPHLAGALPPQAGAPAQALLRSSHGLQRHRRGGGGCPHVGPRRPGSWAARA